DVHFYPHLLKYQAGNSVGRILVEKKVPDRNFYTFNISDHALDFYSGKNPSMLFVSDSLKMKRMIKENGNLFLYADSDGESQLKALRFTIVTEQKFEDFHVQFLSMNFLLPQTRKESLRTKFLLEIAN
ncbi:MAG TPA: hypothetical protein VFJ43_04085, partial [Bacteroidia bacterium]|nr:hypothetical protein [Bacteroidia bacterium]